MKSVVTAVRPPSLPSLPLYAAPRRLSVCFALPCKISPARPTVSRRSSSTLCPLCIRNSKATVVSLLLTKVSRRSLRGFKRAGSDHFVFVLAMSFLSLVLRPGGILLLTEQPESTPRMSILRPRCLPTVRSIARSCFGRVLNCSHVACG
ncbi:hypothetical protein PSPO01_15960 [Paraphaeosphaeria sporulosa]